MPARCGNRIAFDLAVTDACPATCEDCGGGLGTCGEFEQRVAEQLARSD